MLVPGPEEQFEQQETEEEEEVEEPGEERREQRVIVSPPLTAATNSGPGVCVCVSVCTITCVWCAGGRWAGVSATVIVDQPIFEEDEESEKESGDNEKEEDSEMKTTTIGAHTALSL